MKARGTRHKGAQPNRHGRVSTAKVEVSAAFGVPKLPASLCVWDMPGGRNLAGYVAYGGDRLVERAGELSTEVVAGAANKAAAMTLAGTIGAFSLSPSALAFAAEGADGGANAGSGAVATCSVEADGAPSGVVASSSDAIAAAVSPDASDANVGRANSTDSTSAEGNSAEAATDAASSSAGSAGDTSAGMATAGAAVSTMPSTTVSGNAAGFEGASSSTLGSCSSGDGSAGSFDGAAADLDPSIDGDMASTASAANIAFAATAEAAATAAIAGGPTAASLDGEPTTLADDTESDVEWATTEKELQSAISSSGSSTVCLKNDIALTKPLEIPSKANLTINLYGHTLTGASGRAAFNMSGGSLAVSTEGSAGGKIDASACSALIDSADAGTTTVSFEQGGSTVITASKLFTAEDGWKYSLKGTLNISSTINVGSGSAFSFAWSSPAAKLRSTVADGPAFKLSGSSPKLD